MIRSANIIALSAVLSGAAVCQVVLQGPATEYRVEKGIAIAGEMAFLKAEFNLEGRVITGSPYSAQAVTEFTQLLGDGNRISRTNTAFIARDSLGRTRREQSVIAVGPWANAKGEVPKAIFINDPVEGVSYVLDLNSHSANMVHTRQHETENIAREKELRAKKEAERAVRPIPSTSSTNVRRENLGSQVINGVMAEGSRITRTIPAGDVGNERPLDVVTETWFSSELQTIVMSKTSDPRTGDTVYKLTNIDRTEPAASLFTVPADYTVKEGKGPTFHIETRRPD